MDYHMMKSSPKKRRPGIRSGGVSRPECVGDNGFGFHSKYEPGNHGNSKLGTVAFRYWVKISGTNRNEERK